MAGFDCVTVDLEAKDPFGRPYRLQEKYNLLGRGHLVQKMENPVRTMGLCAKRAFPSDDLVDRR